MSAPPGFDWSAELAKKVAIQVATFGRQVTYTPDGGAPAQVTAILVEAAEREHQSPGVVARLLVDLAAFPVPPASGGAVAIDGAAYRVFDVDAAEDGSAVISARLV